MHFAGGILMGRVVIATVSISSLVEVALYAGTSALVGYGVKMAIDCGRKLYKKFKENRRSHE